jgi:large subunit ribosomal protein L24
MLIRSGDLVVVIAGNDRGVRGPVLRVVRQSGKLVVEGVNKVYKHVRRSQKHPQGGRLQKEMPIQASNVLLVCPHCNRGVRLGTRRGPDGTKERFCRRCKAGLGTIGSRRTPSRQTASS